MSATEAFRAVVVQRESCGGGNYFWPVRVYLLLCRVDEKGEPIVPGRATTAPDWVFVRENKRATRRLSTLLEHANTLAVKVNAGEMTFLAAKKAL